LAEKGIGYYPKNEGTYKPLFYPKEVALEIGNIRKKLHDIGYNIT